MPKHSNSRTATISTESSGDHAKAAPKTNQELHSISLPDIAPKSHKPNSDLTPIINKDASASKPMGAIASKSRIPTYERITTNNILQKELRDFMNSIKAKGADMGVERVNVYEIVLD
eukprot:TRINITY_DN7901_c0_g1_i1.p1 TRINITY_DN7901_c0_g1~~TRINITY_DN7901_c0_g1_i1.p1  ORF type:complete len:129 (-),score=28.34 TRINITY_DN7901_c0_g1_i1:76-426(-)